MKSLGTKITREAIVSGLQHRRPTRASPRRVHFQTNGNIAGTAIYIYKVENGKIVELGSVTSLVK